MGFCNVTKCFFLVLRGFCASPKAFVRTSRDRTVYSIFGCELLHNYMGKMKQNESNAKCSFLPYVCEVGIHARNVLVELGKG